MTENEALKAAIDGKRVTRGDKSFYVFWNGKNFRFFNLQFDREEECYYCLRGHDDWEIIPDTVDFQTAWQAFEKGKKIKSIKTGHSFYNLSPNPGPGSWFTPAEIRGEWIILEDE